LWILNRPDIQRIRNWVVAVMLPLLGVTLATGSFAKLIS